MQSASPNLFAVVVPLIVVAVVLIIRGRRMTVKRPLKLNTLWVVPAIFLVIAALSLAQFPPQGMDFAWLAVALVLGAGLGWQRGRLMKIWVDPESGDLLIQGSGWAVVFLVALLVMRWMLRTGLQYEASAGAISPALINNTFVLFALGLFATQRIEMAIRASRLKKSRAEGESGAI